MPSPELKRLGALGGSVDAGRRNRRRRHPERRGHATRRRRALRKSLLVVLAVLVVASVWVTIVARGQVDDFASLPAAPTPPSGATEADAAIGDRGAERPEAARVSRTGGRADPGIAAVDDLALAAPAPDLRRVGFLEARRGTALPMTPIGTLAENANPSKFVPGDDVDGPDYHVLATRGEPWPATSSLAVVLPLGATVHAPVDGQVTEVARYPLSDGRVDVRVRIAPDSSEEVAVELRHLSGVGVAVGDRVSAGESVVGRVRDVRISHPADAITREEEAFLHVEVRPAREAPPPDPNAPAETEGDD